MMRIFSGLLLLLVLQIGLAQNSSPPRLLTDDLDYYLYRAVHAAPDELRPSLNHIGVQLVEVDNGYLITAALEDYPAQEAGLYRGDIIVRADGQPFHPVFSFNEADMAPDGFQALNRSLTLTINRDGREFDVQVRPVFENLLDSYRSASISSVQQFPSGNKMIGYLRLWILSRSSADLIAYQGLFEELAATDGIILDLRNALGFLDQSQLRLVYRGDNDLLRASGTEPDTAILNAGDYPLPQTVDPYRNPVAILVNEYTRGGAELLAWQLDKLNRVISLGQGSAGQLGSWQQLDNGLEYQAPANLLIDGQAIEVRGFEVEREVGYPTQQTGRIDPQFQAAMDLLMGII